MPKRKREPQQRTKLKPGEIADRYGVDVECVLAWIHSGELKAMNAARSLNSKKPNWLVDVKDLQAFEESRVPAKEPIAISRRQMPKSGVIEFFK